MKPHSVNLNGSYRLSLDLGESSIGWCVFALDSSNTPAALFDAGVRIFNNGRNDKNEEPLSVERRNAKSQRTRRDRYLERRRDLIALLLENDLWPESRQEQLEIQAMDVLKLRADAVTQKIAPYELGRVLFHLNQRRGFKSNRVADRKRDDEAKGMLKGIKTLSSQLKNKTLGQVLYERREQGLPTRFRPNVTKNNKAEWDIYPQRTMVSQEIKAIWEVQEKHHSFLNPELFDKVHKLIIDQRPLQIKESGFCTFELEEHRARLAHPLNQEFRIWQEVNNLDYKPELPDRLDDDSRLRLADALNSGKGIKINKKGEASFAEIRKFLGVDLTHEFNLEEAGRKGLKANTVSIQLSQDDYIGEVWHEWDANTQNDFINHVLRTERLEDLLEILRNSFGLDEGQAQNCAQLDLPNGYGHLSLRAIKKILPELKKGLTYDKACLQADENYRHSAMDGDGSLDKLPYYGELLKNSCIGADPKNYSKKFPEKYYGKITNPTIHIGLNQIRKLVNALIEKYGKPSEVHIELARELKIGREEKRKIKQEQKKNRARNEEINEILRERGEKVNYENRLKFKLWEELSTNPLQRCCPFTGKPISIKMLFTEQVEIEHLLPLAITFDDSPANKVVCLRSANRFKSRKSPYDAFSSSPEGYDWNAIYARSRYLPDNKKWRFERDAMDKFNEDEGWHHDRHLIDTQYFARITRRYLTHICPPNKIVGIPGRLTAWLRKKWGLNNILGERNKNRGDHRHHAIDAFVVGCTTRSTLQAISSAVDESRNRVIDEMPLPFPHYRFESIKQSILGITVSFKQDHGISSKKKQAAKFLEKGNTSGELTKGTAYGHVGNTADGLWLIATRKKTEDVTPNHKTIQEIAEPRIRDELKRALDELLLSCSKDDLKREWQAFLHDFSRGNNQLKNKSAPDGIGLPVRHVRLHERRRAETLVGVKQIGQSEPYKYYGVGENAWIDIYCPLKGKDKGKWKGEIANIGNAHDLEYKPCWQLPPSPPARFVMRLRKSDVVMIRRDGEEVPHVVYGIAESGQITLRPHYDALTKDESKKANILISPVASGLRDRCGRKISVDILGRIKDPGSARGKSWE